MPLRWISALASKGEEKTYPIPASDGVQIDKDNDVILARSGKSVYAFSLACPHQNTALRWDAGNNRFQCPKHKSKYRPDGTFIEGRATRSMDRYAVKLAGNNVVVDIDKPYQEDKDNAQWQQAVGVAREQQKRRVAGLALRHRGLSCGIPAITPPSTTARMSCQDCISRREFLTKSTLAVAGAAAVVAGCGDGQIGAGGATAPILLTPLTFKVACCITSKPIASTSAWPFSTSTPGAPPTPPAREKLAR